MNGDSKDHSSSLSAIEAFAEQFGVEPDSLSESVIEMIDKGNWKCHLLDIPSRDRVILHVMKAIVSDELSLAGEKQRWDKGWDEVLSEFTKTGNLDALVPKYIRPNQPVRDNREFVLPVDPDFELHWYQVFRRWLFDTWLKPYNAVYEFGCGTGHNLVAFAQWDNSKGYIGLDWSASAAETVNAVGKALNVRMLGLQFDFFDPHPLACVKGSAVLTIGALEQTGDKYPRFIEWLLEMKPAICVHVEPIIEWYDETNLVDWTAIQYLKKRKYWSGFPDYMQKLADSGQIEIIHKKRTEIGSLFVEGYMIFVWRPI